MNVFPCMDLLLNLICYPHTYTSLTQTADKCQFSLKRKGQGRNPCMCGFSDWVWKGNCCHGGFCRGFVSQSASGGKVQDLIRPLALEECKSQMGS